MKYVCANIKIRTNLKGILIVSFLNDDINYRIKVILETRFFTRLSDFKFRTKD